MIPFDASGRLHHMQGLCGRPGRKRYQGERGLILKNGAMSDSIKAHKILQPGDRFDHWTVLEYIGLLQGEADNQKGV